jgi:two-component system response regulator FixJ
MTAPVLIVDDDPDVRESLWALLDAAGHSVRSYGSAKALLADDVSSGACLIADIRMPEMDGLELQQEIVRRGLVLPVIIVTGHGDVPLAVRAMKAGAIDFIEKPFSAATILESVARAIALSSRARSRSAEAKSAQEALALLTPRERDVFDQIVAGRPNKIAAFELQISPRTVEIHRAHIMDKMRVRSLSDLVRISLAAAAPAKDN